MLGRDVEDAKEKIAHYRQLPDPRLSDLFDIYQILQQIMGGISNLGYAGELYGEHNSMRFADAYNSFVKIDAWFENEIRDSIQECRYGPKTK